MSDEELQAEDWMRARGYWFQTPLYLTNMAVAAMLAAYGRYIRHWCGGRAVTDLTDDDTNYLKEMGISGDDER